MTKPIAALTLALVLAASAPAQVPGRHTFALSTTDFLLDGAPFQIKSGELHPGRIPAEYWRHRIKMAKAMGLNTIAAYVFWNQHEEVVQLLRGARRHELRLHGRRQLGGKGYEPDVTSYDYDAPIDEQGRATPKNHVLRELLASSLPAGEALPPIPDPIPAVEVPAFEMTPFASLWKNLPAPIKSVHPRPFEMYGQNQGLVLYRTTLVGRKSGTLVLTDLHDYATVFVDGVLVGTIDRRLGEKSIDLPKSATPNPVLDILVEGMGHINFAQEMIDRKGITDRVTLSGMTLMNWDVHLLPLGEAWVSALRADAEPVARADAGPGARPGARPGVLFRGSFTLDKPADTFIDMTGYRKGVLWVNGHNLGRYWDIGPQTRLYAPAPFLRAGRNDVIVLDLLKTDASPLRGVAALK